MKKSRGLSSNYEPYDMRLDLLNFIPLMKQTLTCTDGGMCRDGVNVQCSCTLMLYIVFVSFLIYCVVIANTVFLKYYINCNWYQ